MDLKGGLLSRKGIGQMDPVREFLSIALPRWRPMTSVSPQGCDLGSVLFNFVINDIDRWIECTNSKFENDTKMSDVVDTRYHPEGPGQKGPEQT